MSSATHGNYLKTVPIYDVLAVLKLKSYADYKKLLASYPLLIDSASLAYRIVSR
jgi:hypothetical protein